MKWKRLVRKTNVNNELFILEYIKEKFDNKPKFDKHIDSNDY